MADSLKGNLHKEHEHRIKLVALPKECDGVKPIVIKQGVLQEAKNGNDIVAYARIRSHQEPGKQPKYSLGVKHFRLGEESEAEISKDTFDAFYPKNLARPQEKKRYKLKNGWEVNHNNDGTIQAEYEHDKNEKVKVPEHWQEMVKKAFIEELQKIAVPHYKCHTCGWLPSMPESDVPDICPICQSTMSTGPGYDTRVNS